MTVKRPQKANKSFSRRDFLTAAGTTTAIAALGLSNTARAARLIGNAGIGAAKGPAMLKPTPAGRGVLPGSVTAAEYERARELAEDMVKRLTVEQKLDQLTHSVPAVESAGLPKYDYYGGEAIHGLRTSGPVTSFPVPAAMGNSWSPELAGQVYTAISDEARAMHNTKGNYLALYSPPTVNMGARDPRWGRLEENFSEDPMLVSDLAVATIRAMQGDDPRHLKTLACAKHFICNDTESDRHRVSANVDGRSFWEYYTRGFEACVTKGHVATVMSSYNAINGIPCTADPALLTRLLRERWGFRGYVTSDCGAIADITSNHHFTKSREMGAALALQAGCDINCGGEYRGHLAKALAKELITEQDLDRALTRALTGRALTGELDPEAKTPWDHLGKDVLESEANRELAREAGRQTLVLLKNENKTLPIKAEAIKTIAVIGPFADRCYLGGYSGQPLHQVSPLAGIELHFGRTPALGRVGSYTDKSRSPRLRGSYLIDIRKHSWVRYPKQDFTGKTGLRVTTASGNKGGKIEVYLDDLKGKPIASAAVPDTGGWSKFTTYELPIPPIDGQHRIVFKFEGTAGFIANFKDFELTPQSKRAASPHNNADKPLILHAPGSGMTKGSMEDLNAAVAAAKKADVALVFVGIDYTLAGEQHDRSEIDLPEPQRRLIKAVRKANPKTVVVINAQVPVAVNWAQENVPAILSALCAGQEQGSAIADVLFGDYNPGGKVSMTWYKSVRQLPDFHNYDITKRTYMYFQGQPLYPFGHGLSYTTFEYGNLQVKSRLLEPGGKCRVSLDVKNTGSRDGDEIVQLYVHVNSSKVKRPNKQLVAYKRVPIQAGQTQRVVLEVPHDHIAFRYWEEKTRRFVVESGDVDLLAGASSADIKLRGSLRLTG